MPMLFATVARAATRTIIAFLLVAMVAATHGQTPSPTPTATARTGGPGQSPELTLRTGKITLRDGLAELNLPEDFRYLDHADTRKVLVDIWGNPSESAGNQMGMIVPANFDPKGHDSYGVIISYDASGYVKDNDAASLDYAKLLKEMQESAQKSNAEREKEGYPTVEIVGWAAPPRYDAGSKKMYWAKQLRFDHDAGHDTLNYDVRILGRRGVLVLRAVAGMDQLDQIRDATPQILGMVNYNEGHRYADFNPKTDKVAAYGLAALVAGGIAAKAGLFKVLFGVLVAAKKFVVIGVVAVVGFFKRVFGGNKREN